MTKNLTQKKKKQQKKKQLHNNTYNKLLKSAPAQGILLSGCFTLHLQQSLWPDKQPTRTDSKPEPVGVSN